LIAVTEKIKEAMEEGKNYISYAIFRDLRKAFDSVNNNILLNKLNYYGYRGRVNNWLRSYHTGGKQFYHNIWPKHIKNK